MRGDAPTRDYRQARKATTHARRQVDWYRDRLVETGNRTLYEAPYQRAQAELARCIAELDELEAMKTKVKKLEA